MSSTKHTLGDVLARLVNDIDNMNEFMFGLQNILESKSENVTITQTKGDGSKYSITSPSFGYMKGKIEDISTNFDTLLSTNNDVIGLKSADGEVRKFELKRTAQLLSELEAVKDTNITLPTEFRVRNNWFFESFLNPLLYVGLDIEPILSDDIDQFVVKRIIINSVNNDDAADFFDQNYLNNNNINLADLKSDLDVNTIDYFEDDNVVDLEVAVNRYVGSYDVSRILEEEGTQTLSNGDETTLIRNRYKLNTLNYTDVLSDVKNTQLLSEGDVLITNGDSEYRVVTINKTDLEVVLERIFGTDPITIGANILRLKPQPYRIPELQVNVGFNERQVIFIKPVSKAKNLTIDDYSHGVAMYTNDLTIPLSDDSTSTLADYYTNFVSDFGLILMNLAKEKKVPAIIGETPLAPVINASNFKVVQIDQHIQDDKNITNLQKTVKEKAGTEKEIQELNKKIDDIKAKITTTSKSKQESKRLEKQLKEVQADRSDKTENLSTIVTNLTLQLATTPQFTAKKKYAVRGFWQMPNVLSSKYGNQQAAQFKYRYRYLSQTGNQPKADQQNFVDIDGGTKSASFSPWIERLTKPRTKELNPNTGLYDWSEEKVSDSDAVNTNQLDIPIRKGEIVEIQIKTLSEAGWPDNPVESAWSTAVQVPFPENISSEEEGVVLAQKAFADKTRLDFEKSLISKGVDSHIANQFTTGERFFSHLAADIASGFYTSEGNVIDLFEKLQKISSTLESVQQALSTDTGIIKVSVIDPSGNISEVKNGDTVKLFAGYYKDRIKDTTGGTTIFKDGAIITEQYTISISNTSATKLQLISLLFGGASQLANDSDPIANPEEDYHVNRRYDIVPLGVNRNDVPEIGDFKQIPSLQSGQVRSQYVNSRVRDYGLSEELYSPSIPLADYTALLTPTYAYVYSALPNNWGHYLPFDPTDASPVTTDSNIWDGTTDVSAISQGGGYLSEFCIHKNHPLLLSLGASFNIATATNLEDTFRPVFAGGVTVSTTAPQIELPFAHAIHFETSISDGVDGFGVEYYKQASRVSPVSPSGIAQTSRDDSHYPIKLGFKENDEYIIGKFTCGAYLYMFPLSYESASVEGNFPARSARDIEFGTENAINIPVLFQYRCSDKLGYIGGYRSTETLTNIKYQKRMGIDLIIKDDSPFSFDIQVDCQYTKETSLNAPIVQSQGTVTGF